MRTPNELARQVLRKAADFHAEIAERYEQLADEARRFAIALREADVEHMIKDGNMAILEPLEQAKRDALNQLKMLETADPEWWREFHREHYRRKVEKFGPADILLELLAHSAECRNPHNCERHQMLEDRAKKLSK